MKHRAFWIPRRKTMQNHYEITPKSQLWIRNMGSWIRTLTSVMSGPTLHSTNEAGGTLRRELGEPKWAATSHSRV